MSYGGVENSQEELDVLKGATINDIRIMDLPEDLKEFGNDNKVVMNVTLRAPIRFEDQDGQVVEARTVTFEVWQDEEGNGPGYLAFTGTGKD